MSWPLGGNQEGRRGSGWEGGEGGKEEGRLLGRLVEGRGQGRCRAGEEEDPIHPCGIIL